MSAIWYLLALVWILDALRMRKRLASLPVLSPSNTEPSPDHRFITVPGMTLDPATRAAASAYASAAGVELLDLVPANTPALLAMSVAQLVDPREYTQNPIGSGHATGYALLATRTLLSHAGVATAPLVDPVTLPSLARALKRFATGRADIVVAPQLRAGSDHVTSNWPMYAALVGGGANAMFMIRAVVLAVLWVGLFIAPVASVVAVVALHVQVLIVFVGLPLRPRDLLRVAVLRTPIELWSWCGVLTTRLRHTPTASDEVEARRSYYTAQLEQGLDRLFEPRRQDCPLCGSRDLKTCLKTPDLYQHKPGTFALSACRPCGHVFQNPRLSAAGLEFYYADFYDGLGSDALERMFQAQPRLYVHRAVLVKGLSTPKRWLDVGTGHGHFCCVAREIWPETEFDGLDIGEKVEWALRAGWIRRAYHGVFAEVAEQIARRYDVVSLFHCLEHTPDPRGELTAAHVALAHDGLLVIEVPDPECAWGTILGRFWIPWLQPQHLHLFSAKNLAKLLRETGFEPVLLQRAEAHIAKLEVFGSLMLLFSWLAPKPHLPWRPRATWLSKARYAAVWNLGFPVLLLGWLLDLLIAPMLRRIGPSNTYRIVARRLAT